LPIARRRLRAASSFPAPFRIAAAMRQLVFVSSLLLLSACRAAPPEASVDQAGGARGVDAPVPARVAIGAVQGKGLRSPLLGRQVTVHGVITGNFAQGLGGVFIQSERDDGDDETAEGLFVLLAPDVSPPAERERGEGGPRAGDRVEVSGTVVELGDDELSTLTALRDASVRVLGRGAVDARAIERAPDDVMGWERYEGMRLRIDAPLTVSGNGGLASYGELVASFDGRLVQATERAAPGPGAARLAADNARRTLLLDDNRQSKNPRRLWFLPRGLDDRAPLRAGSLLRRTTGILDQRRGDYRLQLSEPLDIRQAPRPEAPDVPGDTRIASLNLHNLFNGDGRGGGFPTERGAETVEQHGRQQGKLVAAVQALRPDVAALMEVENDGQGPDSALGQFVAALNAAGPATDYRAVDSGPRLGEDGIRVAMIYRSSRVTPLGRAATLQGGPFASRSRVPLAQAFRSGAGPVFVVVANHFKSKGCGRDDKAATGADRDQGDGQSCWNPVRVDSARRLAAWLAGDPTGTRPAGVVLLGDLNAYAMEDPLRLLRDAGWRDAFALAGVDAPYSYVYDGQFGRLDHALLDAGLAPRLRGAVEWHSNADEAEAFDYRQDTDGDPWRASDHDPLLLGLDLQSAR
jgi:predicted extracellular nuclease